MTTTSRLAVGLAALTLALTATACAPQPPAEPPAPPEESTSTETTGSPSTEAAPLEDLEVALEPVIRGLSNPLFVTHAGDGSDRLFVVEQGGLVRVVREGRTASRPYLDVRDRISTGGERGLLGLAFAEDFVESGVLYVNYTDRSGDTVVARFTASDPTADRPELSGPEVLLTVAQPYSNHNGGCMAFAPDGTLWVGMGDGGSAGDPENRAQDPDELLGKMLSLEVDGATGRVSPTVVQSGLRNPWRFSFDRQTDDLWIGDVGQNAIEEIDLVSWSEAKGADFGWNLWEGSAPYPPGSQRSRGEFVFPVIEYPRTEGQSVTGGYVYRGERYPQMEGVYFYGDFTAGWIAAARVEADGTVRTERVLPDPGVTPSSFGEDEDGEIYVCDYNGALLRLTAR